MSARLYERLTAACMIVAAFSAIAFDLASSNKWLIGVVGVIAGAVAVGTYFCRHAWFRNREVKSAVNTEQTSRYVTKSEDSDSRIDPVSESFDELFRGLYSVAAPYSSFNKILGKYSEFGKVKSELVKFEREFIEAWGPYMRVVPTKAIVRLRQVPRKEIFGLEQVPRESILGLVQMIQNVAETRAKYWSWNYRMHTPNYRMHTPRATYRYAHRAVRPAAVMINLNSEGGIEINSKTEQKSKKLGWWEEAEPEETQEYEHLHVH